MRFSYKRYIERIFHPDPKLSAFIVALRNSHNFYQESLGNHLHYGINFFNYRWLADDGLLVLKISCFWCKMGGVPTNFVAKIIHQKDFSPPLFPIESLPSRWQHYVCGRAG